MLAWAGRPVAIQIILANRATRHLQDVIMVDECVVSSRDAE